MKMKVRVAEAKTGVRLPDSKVTVKLGSQTIVENKKVKEELLVPIVSGGDYNITVDTGGKYFDMGTPVHIDCTLYKSCEECQEWCGSTERLLRPPHRDLQHRPRLLSIMDPHHLLDKGEVRSEKGVCD